MGKITDACVAAAHKPGSTQAKDELEKREISSVKAIIEDHASTVGDLREYVDELLEKLQPILLPRKEGGMDVKCSPAILPMCATANAIESIRTEVRTIANKIKVAIESINL